MVLVVRVLCAHSMQHPKTNVEVSIYSYLYWCAWAQVKFFLPSTLLFQTCLFIPVVHVSTMNAFQCLYISIASEECVIAIMMRSTWLQLLFSSHLAQVHATQIGSYLKMDWLHQGLLSPLFLQQLPWYGPTSTVKVRNYIDTILSNVRPPSLDGQFIIRRKEICHCWPSSNPELCTWRPLAIYYQFVIPVIASFQLLVNFLCCKQKEAR